MFVTIFEKFEKFLIQRFQSSFCHIKRYSFTRFYKRFPKVSAATKVLKISFCNKLIFPGEVPGKISHFSKFFSPRGMKSYWGIRIPNRDSPVDTFICSRSTQISGRHHRDLCQPGSNKCNSV